MEPDEQTHHATEALLARHGIRPGPRGYDVEDLVRALTRRGWTFGPGDLLVRGKAVEVRVHKAERLSTRGRTTEEALLLALAAVIQREEPA